VSHFLAAQLRTRPGRAFVLACGIAVAAVAFVLLTAATQSSELHVRGTVQRNYRTAYDVLVRPRGARDTLERSAGLVRDNYLSGIYGGISLAQWRQIERMPGVEVAAPVANIGFVLPFQNKSFSIERDLTKAPVQLYRITSSWVSNGVSVYPDTTYYVYFTRRGKFVSKTRWGSLAEVDPGRSGYTLPCYGFVAPLMANGPFDPRFHGFLNCFAAGEKENSVNWGLPQLGAYAVGADSLASFPIAVAAIDPEAEAKLVDLDKAVVSGRYFRGEEGLTAPKPVQNGGQVIRVSTGPVLASTRSYVGDVLRVRVQRLRVPAGTDVPRALESGACTTGQIPCPQTLPPPRGASYRNGRQFLNGLDGPIVDVRTTPISTFYQQMTSTPNGLGPGGEWPASGVRYRQLGPDRLAPIPVTNSPEIFQGAFGPSGYFPVPDDDADVQYRKVSERLQLNTSGAAYTSIETRVVGRFDPNRLPGFSPLSRVPLETFYPPVLEPGNAAASKALHGKDYYPDQNLGGYVAQPPLLLTTIKMLHAYFLNPEYFQNIPARVRKAPISVVQVRVKGVTGPNAVSEARIRLVAQEIHDKTGLDVDVTAGSSPHPLEISLPAGRFGAPPLLLREGWSKKNASISFLKALDRKDLALFGLILVISGFFLANGALAAARVRRAEIGTLLTLGWSRGELFAAVLGELALIGLVAGIVGTAVAVGLVELLSLSLSPWKALLVVPIAAVLAVAAGAVPAWLAARGEPLDAIRPPVTGAGDRGRPVRSLAGMAAVNLRRLPSRALVGGIGLLLAVAALTALLAVERAFHGAVVGTLLGNVISVQVHSSDYVAVALATGLAALSVADVTYLNLRERQAELVTLRTLGWSTGQVARLVGLEALILGTIVALLGALLGAIAAAWVLAVPAGEATLIAVLAAAAGILVALLASLLPLVQIDRLTVPAVLAAE
jgi:putative ABC transport system permease protein